MTPFVVSRDTSGVVSDVVPGTDLFKTAVKYIPEGPASREGRTVPVPQ